MNSFSLFFLHTVQSNTNDLKNTYLLCRCGSNCYYQFSFMDLWVMAVQKYSTLCISQELEPHHQFQFAVIAKKL